MYPVHWRIWLSTDTFVKIYVVFFIDVILVSEPKSFVSVDEIPLPYFSLDFLCFSWFCLFFDLQIILLLFGLLRSDFLLYFLFFVHIDREINEFRVSFYKFRDLLSVQKFKSIFLEINSNYCSSTKCVSSWIWFNSEGSCTFRSPDVLIVLIWLGDDYYFFAN